jgi:hypothetical protein
MKIPKDYISKIGTPQKISRIIQFGDLNLLIRLQKPFEEPPDAEEMTGFIVDTEGKISEFEGFDGDTWMEYGTCLIIEAWSEASQSIVTQGIRKNDTQTDEEFAFGARYMLNNGTDEEWLEVITKRKLDKILKLTCNNTSGKVADKILKQKKKKK